MQHSCLCLKPSMSLFDLQNTLDLQKSSKREQCKTRFLRKALQREARDYLSLLGFSLYHVRCRSIKVSPGSKKPITRDMLRDMRWHGHVTEHMVRDHFKERGLEALLGDARFFEENNMHFIEFEYLQPAPLEDRGVTWLDAPISEVTKCGHGTYWECAPWIMAEGKFMESDDDKRYGLHEYHKTKGVYVTPQFDAWAGHYSWPCNVFGNKCFYGIGC